MFYNAQKVKDNLSIIDVFDILECLGAEPRYEDENRLVCKSICHDGEHHKLVYFADSGNFFCRSNCGTIGDIYNLLPMVLPPMTFNEMINWVVSHCGIDVKNMDAVSKKETQPEMNPNTDLHNMLPYMPQTYDFNPIENYPFAMPKPWLEECIDTQVCKDAGIKFNPLTADILIPHFAIDGSLIGIKTRTMIKEAERHDFYFENGDFRPAGKYQQFKQGETLYSIKNNLSLYGIDIAAKQVNDCKSIVVCEAEKSVLQMRSYNPNIPIVSCNGSFFSKFHAKQLLDCGFKKVVIALDRDYENQNSPVYYDLLDKYIRIAEKFDEYFDLRFVVDRENLLSKNQSPTDAGYAIAKQLISNHAYKWEQVLEMKCGLM